MFTFSWKPCPKHRYCKCCVISEDKLNRMNMNRSDSKAFHASLGGIQYVCQFELKEILLIEWCLMSVVHCLSCVSHYSSKLVLINYQVLVYQLRDDFQGSSSVSYTGNRESLWVSGLYEIHEQMWHDSRADREQISLSLPLDIFFSIFISVQMAALFYFLVFFLFHNSHKTNTINPLAG